MQVYIGGGGGQLCVTTRGGDGEGRGGEGRGLAHPP